MTKTELKEQIRKIITEVLNEDNTTSADPDVHYSDAWSPASNPSKKIVDEFAIAKLYKELKHGATSRIISRFRAETKIVRDNRTGLNRVSIEVPQRNTRFIDVHGGGDEDTYLINGGETGVTWKRFGNNLKRKNWDETLAFIVHAVEEVREEDFDKNGNRIRGM